MRITIAAVGKLKDLERDLVARYADRFDASGRSMALGPLRIAEMAESRAATVPLRKSDEAQRLVKAAGDAEIKIALDEAGRCCTSAEFASLLARHRDSGISHMAFLIGGPDGHDADLAAAASMKLSLGQMTLPHGLARLVLAEQLYRAATIISGHPYHRA